MAYVYVLKSKKAGMLYVGSTRDLKKRFEEHNKGLVPSTRKRKPFILIYYEAYLVESDARSREHQLKLRANALTQLKRRLPASLKS